MVMGPFSRVDFWDRGAAKDLEVPFWARDVTGEGVDRTLDLPCFGAKLKGDFIPPFTCGSDTRRSIIKYFVRDYINKGRQGNSLTEELIREQIQKLVAVWNTTAKYPCKCNQTHHLLECCRSFSVSEIAEKQLTCPCVDGINFSPSCCVNNFYPDSLNVLFDEIPAEDVVKKIVSQIDPYLRKIFTQARNPAFRKYNNPSRLKRWDWASSGLAESATKTSGLFHSTEPIMSYNASEVGYPFRGRKTLWQTCEGLLRQASS
jgi:hypothetical protein